jgi:hypothetical protein
MSFFSHLLSFETKKPSQPQGVCEENALGRFLPQDQDGDCSSLNKRKAFYLADDIMIYINPGRCQAKFLSSFITTIDQKKLMPFSSQPVVDLSFDEPPLAPNFNRWDLSFFG